MPPTFTNLPVTVNTLHISDSPRLNRDKQLEEFLIAEIHCRNFFNQDLTFLQPSTIYKTQTKEDRKLPEPNPTEVPLNTSQETNQPQEENSKLHKLLQQKWFMTELELPTGQLPYNRWNQL